MIDVIWNNGIIGIIGNKWKKLRIIEMIRIIHMHKNK